jgi:hypothetical protein
MGDIMRKNERERLKRRAARRERLERCVHCGGASGLLHHYDEGEETYPSYLMDRDSSTGEWSLSLCESRTEKKLLVRTTNREELMVALDSYLGHKGPKTVYLSRDLSVFLEPKQATEFLNARIVGRHTLEKYPNVFVYRVQLEELCDVFLMRTAAFGALEDTVTTAQRGDVMVGLAAIARPGQKPEYLVAVGPEKEAMTAGAYVKDYLLSQQPPERNTVN